MVLVIFQFFKKRKGGQTAEWKQLKANSKLEGPVSKHFHRQKEVANPGKIYFKMLSAMEE